MVDLAIVGTDRVTANGDVCKQDRNLYLKALPPRTTASVLCPTASADHRFSVSDGLAEIPIEQRSADESQP